MIDGAGIVRIHVRIRSFSADNFVLPPFVGRKSSVCDHSVTDLYKERAWRPLSVRNAVPRFGTGATALLRSSCSDQSQWPIFALASIGVCTLAATLIAVLAPSARPVLLQEDGIIEMASVACLAAGVLGAGAASAIWGLRVPLLVAGLIGFAELMDETSFGSRLFGFQPPALYGGGELDGFHDLLILAYRLLRDVDRSLARIWVGLLLTASLGIMMFALTQLGNGIRNRRSGLTDHVLIFLHVGFIGVAQVIDIATASNALSAVEEMFEFNASLALVFYIAQQAHRSRAESTARLSV